MAAPADAKRGLVATTAKIALLVTLAAGIALAAPARAEPAGENPAQTPLAIILSQPERPRALLRLLELPVAVAVRGELPGTAADASPPLALRARPGVCCEYLSASLADESQRLSVRF